MIRFINQRDIEKNGSIQESLTPKIERIEGKVLQFDQDRDDNAWTFILVELSNGSISLKCLHDQKIQDISEKFLDYQKNEVDLSEETNFVFFFSPKDNTEVMIHNGTWFYVYEINFDKEKDDIQIR